jgi:hypothetical protein
VHDDWKKLGILEKNKIKFLTKMILLIALFIKPGHDYSKQLTENLGSDIFNKENIKKLPEYLKNKISKVTAGKY